MRYVLSALAIAVVLPASAVAQERATVQGTVVDESQGVLPGVTVTATETSTGRGIFAVTDGRGEYRFDNLNPGTYSVQADLPGFRTMVVTDLELLVGTNAEVPFTMQVGGIEEMIVVTSEVPLVDLTSSEIVGNVDRREMETLPLQGRNWLELSLIVKGVTANNVSVRPGVEDDDQFQLNLDGQQITQKIASAGFGQPKLSREAIAEFQIVTNMFDITQGRSVGMQVQAISRSGTNNLHGVTYGYFRNSRFNAPDPVAKQVLPYANQQVGGTLGGPIVRDKAHYFFSYEYEREPSTAFLQPTRLPGQEFSFATKGVDKSWLGRVDYQRSNDSTMTFRATKWGYKNPFAINSGTAHPSRAAQRSRDSTNISTTWSRVISPTLVTQLRVGYSGFAWKNQANPAMGTDTPQYQFPGLTIGGQYNYPQTFGQDTFSARYEMNWHRDRHNIKFGGEFLRVHDTGEWFLVRRGRYRFSSRPSEAELERRFPADAWNDPSRWDVSGLEPFLQRIDMNFHRKDWLIDIPRPTVAIWFGDNWELTDNLTVNYGIRWDDDWGAMAPTGITESSIPIDNGKFSGDFGYRANIRDHDNFAPRTGFAYNVGGRNDLVIRGGSGLYYSTPISNVTFSHQVYNQMIANSLYWDGEPGFIEDPTRGLTEDDYLSGRVPLPPQAARIIDPDTKMPYTWQNSLGFQKQLGPVMAFEADLTHWTWYNDTRTRDMNLFFDPETGYNKDPKFGRPNPNYSQVNWFESTGKRDNLTLSTGFTRRFQDGFQGGVTYSHMFYAHDDGTIGWTSGYANNTFDHLDAEWGRSQAFQRHTLRVRGMYELPYGVSVSAIYFYGSGNPDTTSIATRPYGKPGTNRLNLGDPIVIPESVRDRFDGPDIIGTGEVVPKNALMGFGLHKVDLRLSKDISFGGMLVTITGEVFNLFNHDNFGNYVGQIDSSRFGQVSGASGNAYVPRSGQLGVRFAF